MLAAEELGAEPATVAETEIAARRQTIDDERREAALTPDLLNRLKAHKAELLAMLRPATETAPALPAPTSDSPAKPAKAVCQCGSTTWLEVPIHGGQSMRRDCARCRRFIDFPVWYGR